MGLLFLPALLLTCVALSATASQQVQRVSLLRLLANPDKYDGQYLQVSGYLVYEEENHTLYFSPDDATYGISNGGIELNFFGSKINTESIKHDNRRYISLSGRFHANAESQWPMPAMTGRRVLSFSDVESIQSPPYVYALPR
jgi:hypothetical protein